MHRIDQLECLIQFSQLYQRLRLHEHYICKTIYNPVLSKPVGTSGRTFCKQLAASVGCTFIVSHLENGKFCGIGIRQVNHALIIPVVEILCIIGKHIASENLSTFQQSVHQRSAPVIVHVSQSHIGYV